MDGYAATAYGRREETADNDEKYCRTVAAAAAAAGHG